MEQVSILCKNTEIRKGIKFKPIKFKGKKSKTFLLPKEVGTVYEIYIQLLYIKKKEAYHLLSGTIYSNKGYDIYVLQNFLRNKISKKELLKSIISEIYSTYSKENQERIYKDILKFKKPKKLFKQKIERFNSKMLSGEISGELDLITDRFILDIKTTKFPIFTFEMYMQLLLYKQVSDIKDKNVGIYFAKYDKIVTIKRKKMKKDLKKLKKNLKDLNLI